MQHLGAGGLRIEFDLQLSGVRLSLVFRNIIQNAIKFGRSGGAVLVGAELEGQMLKISFYDDGPGIPPSALEYLGVLLYQVDRENTGEVPGGGVGLALVYEIVQAHGGQVKISSPVSEGGGTGVEVLIPGVGQATFRNIESDTQGDTQRIE